MSSLSNFYKIKILFAHFIGKYFFEEKYLQGKFFVKYGVGWEWVLRSILWQKILRVNAHVPFPVSPFILISYPETLFFDNDSINIFQGVGNYFCTQWDSKIVIGKNVWIAPNVGVISANHDLFDPNSAGIGESVEIGDNSWIGMNAVILPGVTLGKHTVVGAGSIVTKSFIEGNVMIAGNPARVIRSFQ